MIMLSLEVIWYFVIGAAAMFYIVLDGFDLGVGALQVLPKKDEHRRIFLNAIGPVWDGNEVWLVVLFGAMFAGFPLAYATLASSFYTLIMIMLAGLIFRAVAIEFRSKIEHMGWRHFWDWVFCLASIVITFAVGILLANLVKGIPLDENYIFQGSFATFISPYSLMVGLTSVALFSMHGVIYLIMKTEGEIHDMLRGWSQPAIGFFVITFSVMTLGTLIYFPYMAQPFKDYPVLFLAPVVLILAIGNVLREISLGHDGRAFISSCVSIVILFLLFGIGIFPTLIRSSINPDLNSLTYYNAASSEGTLWVLMLVAGLGVPMVLAYGYWIYRIFRGKVKLEHTSY